MKTELLSTARDGEGLLEYLKRSPVSEHLGGKTFLDGDGGQVDSVLSPHMEDIMKPSKLWKKERVGLLLLISENPRPTNSDQHDPSYQYETGGASLYNHS